MGRKREKRGKGKCRYSTPRVRRDRKGRRRVGEWKGGNAKGKEGSSSL